MFVQMCAKLIPVRLCSLTRSHGVFKTMDLSRVNHFLWLKLKRGLKVFGILQVFISTIGFLHEFLKIARDYENYVEKNHEVENTRIFSLHFNWVSRLMYLISFAFATLSGLCLVQGVAQVSFKIYSFIFQHESFTNITN